MRPETRKPWRKYARRKVRLHRHRWAWFVLSGHPTLQCTRCGCPRKPEPAA